MFTVFPSDPILKDAADHVLKTTAIDLAELRGPGSTPDAVAARAMFVWIVRSHAADRITFRNLAYRLDRRGPNTVRALMNKTAPRLRRKSPEFRMACDQFKPKEPAPCQ